MRQAEIQKAVFDLLVIGVDPTPVYDDVPQGASFPYVVIGDDTSIPWDTDDSVGSESTLTIHVWSRYNGRKEMKDLMRKVYTSLNRKTATLSGGVLIDMLFEFAESFLDSDGESRHGVMRIRATIDG